MGIHGLWQVLEPTGRPVNIHSLRGKVLSVAREGMNSSADSEAKKGVTEEDLSKTLSQACIKGDSDMEEVSSLQGKELLQSLLNKWMKINLTDGRTLTGNFLCVDRDANIIIGSATEYSNDLMAGEPRVLGLAMVPGRHVVSINVKKDNFIPLIS